MGLSAVVGAARLMDIDWRQGLAMAKVANDSDWIDYVPHSTCCAQRITTITIARKGVVWTAVARKRGVVLGV